MEIELFFSNELERDLLAIDNKPLSEENHELVLYWDVVDAQECCLNDLIREEPWMPKKQPIKQKTNWILPLYE